MDNNNFEIERKFLVKEMPADLDKYEKKYIRQAYISLKPVMRLRQQDDEYIFTFKGLGTIKRLEFEYPLTKEEFETLWNKIESNVIEKTRYLIPIDDSTTAELDIYEKEFDGFENVEVEFKTEEAAKAFKAPEWFGKEVTEDKHYSNSYMSIFGNPVKK